MFCNDNAQLLVKFYFVFGIFKFNPLFSFFFFISFVVVLNFKYKFQLHIYIKKRHYKLFKLIRNCGLNFYPESMFNVDRSFFLVSSLSLSTIDRSDQVGESESYNRVLFFNCCFFLPFR